MWTLVNPIAQTPMFWGIRPPNPGLLEGDTPSKTFLYYSSLGRHCQQIVHPPKIFVHTDRNEISNCGGEPPWGKMK